MLNGLSHSTLITHVAGRAFNIQHSTFGSPRLLHFNLQVSPYVPTTGTPRPATHVCQAIAASTMQAPAIASA